MLQGLMGRYLAQEDMALLDYYTESKKSYKIGVDFDPEQVEQYTLIDLGGLDSNIMHIPCQGYNNTTMKQQLDSNSKNDPDFVWFVELQNECGNLLVFCRIRSTSNHLPKYRSTQSFWLVD